MNQLLHGQAHSKETRLLPLPLAYRRGNRIYCSSHLCRDRRFRWQEAPYDAENLIIGEATSDKFLEYVDVEGVVQPILTIQINTREAGSVDRIIAEEGTMMNKGDTILTLNNPDLIRAIEDQQDEWEKQLILIKEKEIEMENRKVSTCNKRPYKRPTN